MLAAVLGRPVGGETSVDGALGTITIIYRVIVTFGFIDAADPVPAMLEHGGVAWNERMVQDC